MIRLLAIVLGLLAFPAFAQTPGTINLQGPSTLPGAPQITPAEINAAINAALAGKCDYPGCLTNLSSPPPIGGVAPNTGSFTALTGQSAVIGSPPGGNEGAGTLNASGLFVNGVAVVAGGGTGLPLTGGTVSGLTTFTGAGTGLAVTHDFTVGGNVAVTGALSGAGVTALFASPPAIGSVAAGTGVFTTFNAWAPQFGVRDDSNNTPAAVGAGYAVGDVLTLNDGCATHATLTVQTITGSAVTLYNISNKGICLRVPSNPVAVSSTTGAGTGATFTLSWAPLSAGLFASPAANINGSNLFIGGAISTNYAGAETIVIGAHSGNQMQTGSFNTLIGMNTNGQSGCAGPATVNESVSIGTDSLRNGCGNSRATVVGTGAMLGYTQIGTGANNFMFGTAAYGGHAMLNWNGASGFPWNTAVGDTSCRGAVGATFTNGTCVGSNTGFQLTTAANFLILAGGGNGNVGSTTYASGNGVILIGSGRVVVDTPLASTFAYMNIENVLIVNNTVTPAASLAEFEGFLNVKSGLTAGGTGLGTTDLAASGAVSGTGFDNLFASPPQIGIVTPARGSFTTFLASTQTRLVTDIQVGNASTSTAGFFGNAPVVRPAPTGACAGNTGCQALRDALGSVGLIATGGVTN